MDSLHAGQTHDLFILSTKYLNNILDFEGDRSLAGYGQNLYGQLGLPANQGTLGPVKIPLPGAPTATIKDVALGWLHSVVLTSN